MTRLRSEKTTGEILKRPSFGVTEAFDCTVPVIGVKRSMRIRLIDATTVSSDLSRDLLGPKT